MSAQGYAGMPAAKKLKFDDDGASTSLHTATNNAAPGTPSVAPSLNIHPSRLGRAPALKAASKSAGASGTKEKTKAKQRYLKAKKDRKKARKKAAPKGAKKKEAQPAAASATLQDEGMTFPEEAALQNTEKAGEDSSDSGSDSDSDSDSDSSSSSSDSEAGTAAATQPEAMDVDDRVRDDSEEDDQPKTPQADGNDDEEEVVGLQRFPAAGIKEASDPALIRQLGLPEGLSHRTVVNPSLSKPLTSTTQLSAGSEGGAVAQTDFANVSLSESVRNRLEMLGVSEWFAVQVSVIPALLSLPHSKSLYRPHAPPRDICVSAPTGSGKTLAYSVPIVEVLRTRLVTRLRALIVLPTRDLVSQVKSTIELIAKGTGLKVGTATGQHSFAHEQGSIMNQSSQRPKVDILIATPGRLIDHLDSTPGFKLSHLRFLVIDEADRLLSQSFQEWLRKVLQATEEGTPASAGSSAESLLDLDDGPELARLSNDDAQAPFRSSQLRGISAAGDGLEQITPAVQKLLFSATLTRDPAKIAALGLRHPHYITIQADAGDGTGASHESFSLPQSLREHMLITTAADKPLELLRLLHRPANPVHKVLCFTKSVESAARLVKLVELFEESRSARGLPTIVAQNFSSELKAGKRQKIMDEFSQGKIDLLVCSDLISRGIDLPDVQHVISYDVPVDAAKYVHRVGRTARANREGDAWTLVEEQEARYFKGLLKTIVRQGTVEKVKAAEAMDPRLQDSYAEALQKMADFYKGSGGEAAR